MTKRIGKDQFDDFEGDCVYLAKEILQSQNMNQITTKADIFSLGLSLLEIIYKIELPPHGQLWNKLREHDFNMTEFEGNSNINVPQNMQDLIKWMLNPSSGKRPSAEEVILQVPELSIRYNALKEGKYKK